MHRLNFLEDEPWDEVNDDLRMRRRWFGHPLGTDMLGASLTELLPGSPGDRLHMHYGLEEMFFVLSGTPTVRTPDGEEQLSPGEVVYFPEGPDGLHTFSNPTDESVRLLGSNYFRTAHLRWDEVSAVTITRPPIPSPQRRFGWVLEIACRDGRRVKTGALLNANRETIAQVAKVLAQTSKKYGFHAPDDLSRLRLAR